MSLIKKTFVLTDKTPKGYVTLVRVGNESGAKIVGETFTRGMKAYIRIGKKSQTITLAGKRTEIELDVELSDADEIGCVVYADGKIIATGGKEPTEREKKALFVETEVKSEGDTEKKEDEYLAEVVSVSSSEIVENEREDTLEETATKEGEIEENEKSDSEEGNGSAEDMGGAENDMLIRLKEEKSGYYIGISDKIDELFVVYPSEKLLAEAIPESEWVKINYDGEDYYVVGRLKDAGKVKYLGYGVPGFAEIKPPKVADGIASWFPLDGLSVYDGYWLFFQDAETGRIDG